MGPSTGVYETTKSLLDRTGREAPKYITQPNPDQKEHTHYATLIRTLSYTGHHKQSTLHSKTLNAKTNRDERSTRGDVTVPPEDSPSPPERQTGQSPGQRGPASRSPPLVTTMGHSRPETPHSRTPPRTGPSHDQPSHEYSLRTVRNRPWTNTRGRLVHRTGRPAVTSRTVPRP